MSISTPFPVLLQDDHKILGSEYCSGYTDIFGTWNTGFYCPQSESKAAISCCGTPTYKYCCTEKDPNATEITEVSFAPTFDRTPVIIGIIGGLFFVLTFIIITSCYFCSCCLLYRKTRTHIPPGLYRLPLTSSSTTSALLNTYSSPSSTSFSLINSSSSNPPTSLSSSSPSNLEHNPYVSHLNYHFSPQQPPAPPYFYNGIPPPHPPSYTSDSNSTHSAHEYQYISRRNSNIAQNTPQNNNIHAPNVHANRLNSSSNYPIAQNNNIHAPNVHANRLNSSSNYPIAQNNNIHATNVNANAFLPPIAPRINNSRGYSSTSTLPHRINQANVYGNNTATINSAGMRSRNMARNYIESQRPVSVISLRNNVAYITSTLPLGSIYRNSGGNRRGVHFSDFKIMTTGPIPEQSSQNGGSVLRNGELLYRSPSRAETSPCPNENSTERVNGVKTENESETEQNQIINNNESSNQSISTQIVANT